MKTGICLALLLCIATPAAAETIVWILPEGVDPMEVANRLRIRSAWPEIEGADEWKAPLGLGGHVLAGSSNRLTVEAERPEGASLDVLEQLVLHFCRQVREERLASLPALILIEEAEHAESARKAEELRARMQAMLGTGEGIVSRADAVAASAERMEELRRRVVDARIEMAVVTARAHALRLKALNRRETLERQRKVRILRMTEEMEKDLNVMFTKGGELHRKALDAIEEVERESLDDDEILSSLLGRFTDLEVETIGMEERVRSLTSALEAEQKRSLEILNAVELVHFQQSMLAPVQEILRKRARKVAGLKRELDALESDRPLRRVKLDPATGDLPKVFVLGRVNRPGEYVLTGDRMVLSKLIALAGDFAARAAPRELKLIRRKKDGQVYSIRLDFHRIVETETDDLVLEAGDIVYVPESR